MWRIAVLALAVWSFEGLAFAGEQEGMEKTKATYQNICQSCHGERGDGKGITAPTLRTKPKDFAKLTDKSEEHLFKAIKEGGAAVKLSPLMIAYASQLSDEEIRQMVRYVLFLGQPKK
jgi:cytochrome c553